MSDLESARAVKGHKLHDTFQLWHFWCLRLHCFGQIKHVLMLILSGSDTFWLWHFLVLALSGSTNFQFRHFQALTCFFSKITFWHFPILTLFDSSTFDSSQKMWFSFYDQIKGYNRSLSLNTIIPDQIPLLFTGWGEEEVIYKPNKWKEFNNMFFTVIIPRYIVSNRKK